MAYNHSMDYLTSLIYNQATPVEESLTAEQVAGEIEEAKSKKVSIVRGPRRKRNRRRKLLSTTSEKSVISEASAVSKPSTSGAQSINPPSSLPSKRSSVSKNSTVVPDNLTTTSKPSKHLSKPSDGSKPVNDGSRSPRLSVRSSTYVPKKLSAGASFGSRNGRGSKPSSQRGSARNSLAIQRKKEKRKSLKEKEDLRRTKTFRKIEAELTERRRQKKKEKSGKESKEEFVDTTRRMAVQQVDDLKGHIMKRRGIMQRSKCSHMSEKVIVLTILGQAMHELSRGRPDISLQYIQVGLKSRPNHADLLLIKGKCCIALNMFSEALEIAERVYNMRRRGSSLALSLQDQNAILLTVKGDALFSLGNSEHALLSYHRAVKLANTKEKKDLATKIYRAKLSIGLITDKPTTICFYKLDWCLQKLPLNFMVLPWEKTKTSLQRRNNKANDLKFLNNFANDRAYLRSLSQKLGPQTLSSPTDCYPEVKTQIRQALVFLAHRKDFWSWSHTDKSSNSYDDINKTLMSTRSDWTDRNTFSSITKRQIFRRKIARAIENNSNPFMI